MSETQWNSVDWGLPNRELAERLDFSPCTISHWRKRLGKPQSPWRYTWRRPAGIVRALGFNWTLSNAELGRRHQLSRERVRQLRKRLFPLGAQ